MIESRKNFAIVCDSACDLPLSVLERAGVALVPLKVRIADETYRDCIDIDAPDYFVSFSSRTGQVNTYSPSVEELADVYKSLVSQGYTQIVSVHVSSEMRDAYQNAVAAAHETKGARIQVMDTRGTSGKFALVLARLACDRDAGFGVDECVARAVRVAQESRMLVIPSAAARPDHGIGHRSRGILGHVTSLQRRALGIRGVFEINGEGQANELFRSSELSRLSGFMARTMSAYAQKMGPVIYVEVSGGVPKFLSVVEKPLDTNEFESDCAAVLDTNPTTTSQLGVGAVGLAYVPQSLLDPAEAASFFQVDEALDS
ncbi:MULTISPECIES: DegV family protein [Atopobiaceae]|uniref:EDD domain protein, DegV family n=1 Tax=Parafannyhessea umbonata TaxID=604330 RepID=A0A1H6IMN7_9ACTN|nr:MULTISPECIES: DegV family protein [Atopobiaceae]SEH48267.1 EDD domain protein, DegV family [Parafannyhessea umbonata]SJZ67874.1 EDD domain protein, DegV family [Olsenella sp. KH1P3]